MKFKVSLLCLIAVVAFAVTVQATPKDHRAELKHYAIESVAAIHEGGLQALYQSVVFEAGSSFVLREKGLAVMAGEVVYAQPDFKIPPRKNHYFY